MNSEPLSAWNASMVNGNEPKSQLFRSPSGANQLDHLAPEGRRVRGLDFGMVDTSSPKGQVSTKSGQLHFTLESPVLLQAHVSLEKAKA